MPSQQELIALFGDDFDEVLRGLSMLPPEIRELLDNTMNKMLYDADIFANRVNKTVQTQRASGIAFSSTQGILTTDMLTGGRVFGELKNSIKESLVEGINQTGNAGSFQAYDPDEKTMFMWVTVAGHKICQDCAPRGGEMATLKEWETRGMPGSGWSVCRGYCYCILDPSGKISPRIKMEERAGKKIQEKGATIRPKPPTPKPTPAVKPTGKTTYTNYKKGSVEIEKYFKNQEKMNPANIQLMQEYSSSKYHSFNLVGRKWSNDIALGNSALMKHISIFEKTLNKKGNVFRVVGADAWKEKFTKLKTFLNKTPNYEGVSYRGLKFADRADLDTFLTRFSKDNIVEANSFWSATTEKKIAQGFAKGSHARHRVNITIEGKTGTILNEYARWKNEKEVLFNAGTKFRVKSVRGGVSKTKEQIVNMVLEEI